MRFRLHIFPLATRIAVNFVSVSLFFPRTFFFLPTVIWLGTFPMGWFVHRLSQAASAFFFFDSLEIFIYIFDFFGNSFDPVSKRPMFDLQHFFPESTIFFYSF